MGYAPDEICREVRELYGKELCALLDSPSWSDICINADGSVFLDDSIPRRVNISVNPKDLIGSAKVLANYANKEFNSDTRQALITIVPIMNFRVTYIGPPAVSNVVIAFRKPNTKLFTYNDLIDMRMMTIEQGEVIRNAVLERRNIVFSGGTGSGKTTVMNSFLSLIPASERIYCIEEIPEIRLTQPNVVCTTTNKFWTYTDAIATALALDPDRIMIGECRYGDQTMGLLKLWNTGHPGGMTTLHANNTGEVVKRIDQMCSEVSVSSQREMIMEAVDLIIQMGRVQGSSKRKIIDVYDLKKEKHFV